jgi:hypothetical protein
VDVAFERFFHYEAEVRAFGAITIIVFPFILVLLESCGKHFFSLVYLHADLGQVTYLQGGAVFVDERLYVNAVELQVTVFELEIFLGENKCLLYEVVVRIIHLMATGLDEIFANVVYLCIRHKKTVPEYGTVNILF